MNRKKFPPKQIRAMLKKHGHNVAAVARILGVSRQTVYNYIHMENEHDKQNTTVPATSKKYDDGST